MELFERHFYDGSHFFRVVPRFLVQFGISYTSDMELKRFANKPIQDDPPRDVPFHKGIISYAGKFESPTADEFVLSRRMV